MIKTACLPSPQHPPPPAFSVGTAEAEGVNVLSGQNVCSLPRTLSCMLLHWRELLGTSQKRTALRWLPLHLFCITATIFPLLSGRAPSFGRGGGSFITYPWLSSSSSGELRNTLHMLLPGACVHQADASPKNRIHLVSSVSTSSGRQGTQAGLPPYLLPNLLSGLITSRICRCNIYDCIDEGVCGVFQRLYAHCCFRSPVFRP